MKKGLLIIVGALALFVALVMSCRGADVQFRFQNAQAAGLTNRTMKLFPTGGPFTNGAGVIVTRDLVSGITDTNGSLIVSNVYGWTYRSEIQGTFTTTTNYFNLPVTNGLIQAADYSGTATNGQLTYTQSQIDGSLVHKAGDTMSGALTNRTGIYGNGVGLTNLSGYVPSTNGVGTNLNLYTGGDTNLNPFSVVDRYGSNLFSITPSHAGSNYWHVLIGEFTQGRELPQNISDMVFKMTQNGFWQVDFGATTNAFWSFGSRFSWGDPSGETQDLFDHQARFFPQHIEPNPVNNGSGPGVAVGSAAGSGASVSVTSPNTGTDVALRIQLTTGSSGLGAGGLFTVTYSLAYGVAPHVVFSATGTNAAAAAPAVYLSATTSSSFTLSSTAALVASKNYTWDIITIE